jgi:2-phosphoglycerate kinase
MPGRDRIIAKRDQTFPYSRGLMAQSLMGCGIPPDRAYRAARIVHVELRRGEATTIASDDLRELVCAVLEREEGAEAVDRYRRWHGARHHGRPLIVLIGGAPGSGKSTVATEVAHRLGITRIVSTDVVRQVMRGVIAREVLPQIHTSSFAAGDTIPVPLLGDVDSEQRMLVGFAQQSETVRVGVGGVVDRALQERFPLVIEGVHLVPGAPLVPDGADATVVELCLVVADSGHHRSHFHLRSDHTGDSRPAARYVRSFEAIRSIQAYLTEQADEHGVPVVETEDLDTAVRSVLDLVLERVVSAPS